MLASKDVTYEMGRDMKEGCHRVVAAERLGWIHLAVHFDVTVRCPSTRTPKRFSGQFDNSGHPRPYPKPSSFDFMVADVEDSMIVTKKLPNDNILRRNDGWYG